MATVREAFDFDTRVFTLHRSQALANGSDPDVPLIEFIERAHADFDSGARYVSFYLPADDWQQACAFVLEHSSETADLFRTDVQMTTGHATLPTQPIEAADLPYSGRVYVYVDADVADDDRNAIWLHGRSLGLLVDVRDRSYVVGLADLAVPEAFISHATADKEAVARPLAIELSKRGTHVWFDEFSLRVGDSLRESINDGLASSKFCVLVVSPALLANTGWAQQEFDSISQREVSEGRRFILPVWHGVNTTDVQRLALWLGDRVAANTADGIPNVADDLAKAIARGNAG